MAKDDWGCPKLKKTNVHRNNKNRAKIRNDRNRSKKIECRVKKQAQILDGKLKGAWQTGCAAIGAVAGATAVFVNQTSKAVTSRQNVSADWHGT